MLARNFEKVTAKNIEYQLKPSHRMLEIRLVESKGKFRLISLQKCYKLEAMNSSIVS